MSEDYGLHTPKKGVFGSLRGYLWVIHRILSQGRTVTDGPQSHPGTSNSRVRVSRKSVISVSRLLNRVSTVSVRKRMDFLHYLRGVRKGKGRRERQSTRVHWCRRVLLRFVFTSVLEEYFHGVSKGTMRKKVD